MWITVVQSLHTPPRPHEPVSDEQQGNWATQEKRISFSIIQWYVMRINNDTNEKQ
jgi:hypothetical protein